MAPTQQGAKVKDLFTDQKKGLSLHLPTKGLGHVPRPRNFTIDDQSSSEGFPQTADRQFSPSRPGVKVKDIFE